MYFDQFDDNWNNDNDWNNNDDWNPQGSQFFPPIGNTPPFQPPFVPPQFGPRPPRPRPPFFPPGMPGLPGSQGIRRCLNRNTMIMLNNGRSFWFFPTNITPEFIMGFRMTRNGWIRDTINRRNILWFDCQ